MNGNTQGDDVVVIIGGGASGITLAHTLNHHQAGSIRGTW